MQPKEAEVPSLSYSQYSKLALLYFSVYGTEVSGNTENTETNTEITNNTESNKNNETFQGKNNITNTENRNTENENYEVGSNIESDND